MLSVAEPAQSRAEVWWKKQKPSPRRTPGTRRFFSFLSSLCLCAPVVKNPYIGVEIMSDYDELARTRGIEPSYEEMKEQVKLQERIRKHDEKEQQEWERKQEKQWWPGGPEEFARTEEPAPAAPPPPKTCRHLRESGRYCGSLALKGRDYCIYHLRDRGRRLKMARARARREHLPLQLPPLEDLYAVQVSIMLVTDWLLNGKLDRRDASLALYGLQQAATNLGRPREVWEQPSPFELTDDEGPSEYEGFEEDFGLPKGLDPDTPPEVVFPETEAAVVSDEQANLMEVTPLDVELAEIQHREGPEAVWRKLKQVDEAGQRRYKRAQAQLAHARNVVRAAAQNAANQARKAPQAAAAGPDAVTMGKDQPA